MIRSAILFLLSYRTVSMREWNSKPDGSRFRSKSIRIAASVFLPVMAILFVLLCQQPSFSQSKLEASNLKKKVESTDEFDRFRDFSNKFCIDCHQGEDSEGEFDIEGLVQRNDYRKDYQIWKKVLQKIGDQSMPPSDYEQPLQTKRTEITKSLEEDLENFFCGKEFLPPPPMLRRLNRTEYANTLRDLLGISIDVSSGLPEDGAGGEGFDNAAETLFISPIHAEKYLSAATKAIDHALKDPRSRRVLLGRELNQGETPLDYGRFVLKRFLPKAFRRKVTESEFEKYLKLFKIGLDRSGSFQEGIQLALKGVLISPKFLFHVEQASGTGLPGDRKTKTMDSAIALDDYSVASRMSYFLWASMPDEKLFQLAKEGKLRNTKVLTKQVQRMLKAKIQGRPKVRDFADSFVSQWLETRRLGREFLPDKKVAPRFDSELLGGMKYEPVFYFEDLITSDRSILQLIQSDYTFVNRRLARHYRIKGEFREQPKRTDLKKGGHRGGILSMAAVLAVSSYPHRTSPVLRGKYVLETVLGQTTPPPPSDVPPLNEEKVRSPSSLREQLELHRKDPSCASCHDAMDPIGFGLENYDILGRYRTRSGGKKIDNQGLLPDGTKFSGPVGLQKVILVRKEQFHRNLTEKLLGFALSRGLLPEDRCLAKEIASQNAKNNYRIQDLLTRIVLSRPFRETVMKSGSNDSGTNKVEE